MYVMHNFIVKYGYHLFILVMVFIIKYKYQTLCTQINKNHKLKLLVF